MFPQAVEAITTGDEPGAGTGNIPRRKSAVHYAALVDKQLKRTPAQSARELGHPAIAERLGG